MSALIIPTLRYKDAVKAIEFLCSTFGFKKHLIHQQDDGIVLHAQLLFKNSMIMLGSEKEDDFGKLVATPASNQNMNTMSPYLILDEEEIDAHYELVKQSGADIVNDLKEEDFGGKSYSCKDPEGYLWNFGSYNPWTTK